MSGFFLTSYGASVIHDPNETANYGLAWTNRLWPGATVVSASWTVPVGLTNVNASINSAALVYQGNTYAANTVSIIQLSGGTVGARYTVTCRASMSNGEILDQSFIVDVRAK